MESWGWRIPFWLCLPLGLFGLWMRRKLDDPETFKEAHAEDTNTSAVETLKSVITKHPKQLLKIMGIVVLINTAFYLVLTYMPTYLTNSIGMTAESANWMLIGVQFAMMAVIVPLGALTDRVGRRPILITASLGFMLFSIPAVLLLDTGSILLQIAGMAIFGLFLVMLLSNISASLPALFPTTVRYAGFALGYNVATSLLGGPAGLINEALIQATGSVLVPGVYITITAAIALVSVLTFNETAGRSLRGDIVPGDDDAERLATGAILIHPRKKDIEKAEQLRKENQQ